MHTMKPGMTEREISALLQYEWGKRGCERPAYAPIVGSGFNSTVLHYSDDSGHDPVGRRRRDRRGRRIFACTPLTSPARFQPRESSPPASARSTTLCWERSRRPWRRFSRANRTCAGTSDSLYKVAYDYINTHGKDLHGEPLGKYFIHGLGHYVGLRCA